MIKKIKQIKTCVLQRVLVSLLPFKVTALNTRKKKKKTPSRAALTLHCFGSETLSHHRLLDSKVCQSSRVWFGRGGKRRGRTRGREEKNCPVTVALPRSETSLCKLTLRVCLHCREPRDWREWAGGTDKGAEEEEEEEAEMKEAEGRGEH